MNKPNPNAECVHERVGECKAICGSCGTCSFHCKHWPPKRKQKDVEDGNFK